MIDAATRQEPDVKFTSSGCRFFADCRGFTLLELTVVVIIVGVLFLVAANKYLDLLVDVERTGMEQTLGALRSALALQAAERVIKSGSEGMLELVAANPMELLSEAPFNYLGAFSNPDPQAMEEGAWYFDLSRRELVYRVKHRDYFATELPEPPRSRFQVQPVLDNDRIVGLTLKPVDAYRWLKESQGGGWFRRPT